MSRSTFCHMSLGLTIFLPVVLFSDHVFWILRLAQRTVTLASELSSSVGTFSAQAVNLFPLWSGEVDICTKDVSSVGWSWSSCPAAGDYEFSTDIVLPGVDSSLYSSLYGVTVGIQAKFTFDGAKTVCIVGVHVSKGGYAMSYVGAAVLLFGLVGAMGYRRRRVATIQLKEEEGTVTHFEMMNSDPRSAFV
jgi:hypothetical protein